MKAYEARQITNKVFDERKNKAADFVKNYRKDTEEKIKETAYAGNNICILSIPSNTSLELKNNILKSFQIDGFKAHLLTNRIEVMW